MEGDHSSRIGNGEVEGHTWQVDRIVGCDSDVKGVVAVEAAQCVRTNNCHGGRTECYQRAAGSG